MSRVIQLGKNDLLLPSALKYSLQVGDFFVQNGKASEILNLRKSSAGSIIMTTRDCDMGRVPFFTYVVPATIVKRVNENQAKISEYSHTLP